MLSFKDLTEKKSTKVKINPRLEDIKEGDKKKCSKCDGKGCEHCDDTGYHTESCGGSHGKKKKKPMSEAKKKDDTYLETDFKKRQANNEKARKDLMKGPQMKNPHFESKVYDPMDDPDFDHDEAEATRGQSGKNKSVTIKKKTKKEEFAYVSQEEVSEESNQSFGEEETEILTFAQYNEGVKHGIIKGVKGAVKGAATGAAIGGAIAATGGAAAAPAAAAGLGAGAVKGAAVHGTIGTVRSDKQQDKEAAAVKKARKEEYEYVDEGVKGAIKGAAKGIAKGAALGALGAGAVTAAGLTGGASIPVAAASGAAMHGAYNAVKGATQNDKLHKLRQADQKKRDAKLLASAKTKKEETEVMEFDDFIAEMRRGPAAPGKAEKGEKAKASLDAVKKRQDVLDKHEKKTGTKLDISKSPEGKAHAKNFPGSRQEKKVRGAKETDLQTHNRRVNTYMDRLKKHGKTTKQKSDDEAMAKHTSRFD